MKEEMKAREKRLNAILKNHGICVEWIESVKITRRWMVT